MADVWPATLPPLPLADGVMESAPNTTIRTQMDAGPVKVRQRYTASAYPIAFDMIMDTADLSTLLTFYITTTGFDWTHPRTSAAQNMRFTAPPSWTPIKVGYWKVHIQLEMLP